MILAANFKTNHTRQSTAAWLDDVESWIGKNGSEDAVYAFPPATALCASRERITVGAQNAWPAENGSFTGEIGLDQLREFGTKTVLIGHSERRHVLHESLGTVREKFNFFMKEGYEIFFCVGEPLGIRKSGHDAVMSYISEQMQGIDLRYEKLVLAYEPVWAIGTGETATVEQIRQTHAEIKQLADKPLLYGGSVKVANVGEILAAEGVDGVLVGTASWESKSFCDMLSVSKTVAKGS